jgi:hypothetical protein
VDGKRPWWTVSARGEQDEPGGVRPGEEACA